MFQQENILLPKGWKLQVGDEDLHHPEGTGEMEKNEIETEDKLLPKGWKFQVRDEDLHHPKGIGELKIPR